MAAITRKLLGGVVCSIRSHRSVLIRNSNEALSVCFNKRYFGDNSQSKHEKTKKPQTSSPKETSTSTSILQKLWSSLQVKPATTTSDGTANTDTRTQSNNDSPDWVSMYAEIKQSNHFPLTMNIMSPSEWNTLQKASKIEFMHKFMMKINFFPLKYEEFMCGAHQGMQFVLKCLQQNDVDSLKTVLDEEAMAKIEDLRREMMDEEYSEVGKMRSFLDTVNHAPNFAETSIQTQYFVKYYYQLKLPKNEPPDNEQGDKEMDGEENRDECIIKRCDVTWGSAWLPSEGWTHKISEDGWKVQDINHVSELKAT